MNKTTLTIEKKKKSWNVISHILMKLINYVPIGSQIHKLVNVYRILCVSFKRLKRFSQSDYYCCIIWLMKYSLPVNCREIGICHKSSKEKNPGNRYDRSRISSRYVLTFHVPDWLGWYHHCWRSVPPRRSISPALCPSRHLRALHRHIFVLFVVTPCAHSSSVAPKWMRRKEKKKKKGEKREKNEGGKKGLGDWPADWRLVRS